MNPVLGAVVLQYAAIVGPVIVPAHEAPQTLDRWEPHFPASAPARQRTVASETATAVVPSYVPDVTYPVVALQWSPSYPDRALALRTHASRAPWLAAQPAYVPHVTPGPDDYGGASIPTGSVPILQYQSLAGPLNAPVVPAPEMSWSPVYPERVWPRRGLIAGQQQAWGMDRFAAPDPVEVPPASWQFRLPATLPPQRAIHSSQQRAYFADRFDAPTAATVTALSWAPRYQDVARLRPGLHASRQRPFFTDRDEAPQSPPAQPLSWAARYPDRILVRRSVAPYTWAQPHFAVVINVPVMSWTGHFPDLQPGRRRQPVAETQSVRPVLDLQPDLYGPVFPDRVPGRAQIVRAPSFFAPEHVPDVTHPVTRLSWRPSYDDLARGPARSVAAQEARATEPLFVADVTEPPPALSWEPQLPDLVWPLAGLGAEQQLAFRSDARWLAPDEVVAPDLSAPVYPDAVPGRPPLRQAQWHAQPELVPDVTQPVTPLSWAPVYPDRPARAELHASQQPTVSPRPWHLADETDLVPTLAWAPSYPDRPSRREQPAQVQPDRAAFPEFIPDVTHAVTPVSWAPVFPERVPPRLGLMAASHPAWFMDKFGAPDEVIVPELSWAPTYPDFAPGREPLVATGSVEWPEVVPDVTDPAPALSWAPEAPDWLVLRVPVATGESVLPFTQEVLVTPEQFPVGYPDRVAAQPRATELAQRVAPLYVPDVTEPLPALAWAPSYPDYLWRVVRPPSGAHEVTGIVEVVDVSQDHQSPVGSTRGRAAWSRRSGSASPGRYTVRRSDTSPGNGRGGWKW
jgi:hypothetical protein